MARERRNGTNANQNFLTFRISGTVQGAPYEGKRYDYYTVKVQHGDYYDLVRVAIDAEKTDVTFKDGDRMEITGTIRAFYNKDKKCTEYTLYADT